MGNQCETLIPSKLSYITLLSQQTNNSEVKSIIGFVLLFIIEEQIIFGLIWRIFSWEPQS